MFRWLRRRRLRRQLKSKEGRALLTVQAVRGEAFQSLFERTFRWDDEGRLFRPVSTGLTPHAVKKLHDRVVVRAR